MQTATKDEDRRRLQHEIYRPPKGEPTRRPKSAGMTAAQARQIAEQAAAFDAEMSR